MRLCLLIVFVACFALSFGGVALAAEQPVDGETSAFFFDDGGDSTSPTSWREGMPEKTDKGFHGNGLKMNSASTGGVRASVNLPVEKMRGKKILLSAMVCAQDVSCKPNPWNGIKLMLVIKSPAGANYPQASIGVGSFQWKLVSVSATIPVNAETVELIIGLEGVSGTVWFDNIMVELYNPAKEKAVLNQFALSKKTFVNKIEESQILINAKEIVGPVNPFIFGHNLETASINRQNQQTWIYGDSRNAQGLWDPATGKPRPDMLAFARDIGMKMMRYPGGTIANRFKWKQYVGPLSERTKNPFGIPEFLEWCRIAGVEPLFTTGDSDNPAEAAELVEFLNAPADESHPWAKKRAEGGHPEPYKVVYFELGNESYWSRKGNGKEYAEWATASIKAMRAVDNAIKTGIVCEGTEAWDNAVLEGAGAVADFAIIHYYPMGIFSEAPEAYAIDSVQRGCLVAADSVESYMKKLRTRIKQKTGRDIPLAVTEYNVGCAQEKPIPHRYSWAAAFFSADYLRVLLKPENNVLMANYWHFAGGYWGLLRSSKWLSKDVPGEWRKQAAYYAFRLWGQHTGDTIVSCKVTTPSYEFEGFNDLNPSVSAVVTAFATTRPNGIICLMVFNRHPCNQATVTVKLQNAICSGVKYWQVRSKNLGDNNLKEELIRETSSDISVPISKDDTFSLQVPPASMTAFEIVSHK